MSLKITIDPAQQKAVETKVFEAISKAYPYEVAAKVWQKVLAVPDPGARLDLCGMIYSDLQSGDRLLQSIRSSEYAMYKKTPVGIEEFICGSYFMNARKIIYPEVMKELLEINGGQYTEVVFTGGIGSGKTTAALYTCAYQLYLLSCMATPHKAYDLDPATEILFVFQSIRKQAAKEVGYNRFRAMLENSKYFMTEFPFNPDLKSKLVFPDRIEVHPVTGDETATIGENVMGGMIDELNYMAVVEGSKEATDGGTYDQAVALYNSIARRRKSRFMKYGKMPGILCLVSSRRYPGQFTDIKEEEAKTDPQIYVYDKCTWDVKPDAYSGVRFPVFIGDEFRKPRILDDEEIDTLLEADRKDKVRMIPVEHKTEFERDIINALREVAGVATLARFPFIMDTEAVGNSMSVGIRSIFNSPWCDFEGRKLKIIPKRFHKPWLPRFAHVDLGLTSDSAGLALGCVTHFIEIQRGGAVETLPVIRIDGIMEVKPPRGGEIKFWKIRECFYKLRELGMHVKWITYDSYQSIDSLQLLYQQGFKTGNASLDVDLRGYEASKTALYDGRLLLPKHERCRLEFVSLERDPKLGKIDHPPHGSKDCSDAVAGVVLGLIRRREIYISNGVSMSQIPESIRQLIAKSPDMRGDDG